MKKVSIVVLNWNGYQDTIECLKSISKLKASESKIETLIVDNASTNDSVERIKSYIKDNDKYLLITNQRNYGFAEGNNIGIRHAIKTGADYVFVLNNDTVVDPDVINFLISTAEDKPHAGLISPKIYFAEGYEFHKDRYTKNDLGKVIWYAGGEIDWDNVYASNHGVDDIDEGQFDEINETDFATGAAVLMNVKALKKVGLFDEKLFMYLEDADLSMRMKKRKWEILFAPKAVIWHKVSQSSGIGSQLNDYFSTRNRLVFGMKYAPLRAKVALIRESIRFLKNGRKWQKIGVMDYYIGNMGKGSWK